MARRRRPPVGEVAMRIGEIAELAQVTPRAVRHYHRIGVLPEPERRPNGYREYTVLDLTRLLRIRRLVALGLPLERVRTALDDSPDGAVADELAELEDALRDHIRIMGRRLDAIAIARRSSIPEATVLYDERHEAVKGLLSDPVVRRMESDVSLLLAASGDDGPLEQLRGELADPQRFEELVRVAERLRAVSDDSSEEERDAAGAALRAAVATLPELGVADPAYRALIEDYVERSFTPAQRDVLRRALPD